LRFAARSYSLRCKGDWFRKLILASKADDELTFVPELIVWEGGSSRNFCGYDWLGAAMNELNLARALIEIEAYLKQCGIVVRQHNDFAKFEKIAKRVRGKPASGQFQNQFFDFNAENGFWLEYISGKEPVSVAAFRYDRIGSKPLEKHWKNQQSRIYPTPNKLADKQSPLSEIIKGDVVYIGEFTLPPSMRKNGLGGIMVFLGMLLCVARWGNISWLYGLMDEGLVFSGFAQRMGFTRVEPVGTRWKKEPVGINSADWICAIDNKGMRRWADLIVSEGLEVLLPRSTA